ncbi:MAG TPA: radical SAM protein, partial [Rhodospirillaceae bacterium]|nr:radical SAM protein [Rhodospirillaceae bacterium]
AVSRETADDGWNGDEELPPLRTDVTAETPRTIINYLSSPFVGFDRTINPYRGCEHGCIYCFARPTHAYYGLSAGLDFETKLFAKPNAAALLDRELASKTYKPRHIAIGTNTDPYQPIERKFLLMRAILPVLAKYNHPVSLLTKSALIARDIDLLAPMAEARIVRIMLSITTLDAKLARAMEPRASTPKRRLAAVKALSEAGVPVGVMTAPMIPGLNDHELEDLLAAAKDAGAGWAGYTVIRLPLEVAGLFREWLEAAFPDRAARVMRHIRDMNGGRDYDPEWSRAMAPRSAFARLIDERFKKAVQRLGLGGDKPPLDPGLYRRPVAGGRQLSLF